MRSLEAVLAVPTYKRLGFTSRGESPISTTAIDKPIRPSRKLLGRSLPLIATVARCTEDDWTLQKVSMCKCPHVSNSPERRILFLGPDPEVVISLRLRSWLKSSSPSGIAELLKLNPQTIRNWIDAGKLPAARIGSRRVRVRRSDLDQFLEAASAASRAEPPAPAVDEGPITAWAMFGAAMAEATATLKQPDQNELVRVLESLAAATRELVDKLQADEK